MRSTGYVSSARVCSLLVLLALAFDLAVGVSQPKRTEWLSYARHDCAVVLSSSNRLHNSEYIPGVSGKGELKIYEEEHGPSSWELRATSDSHVLWRAFVEGRRPYSTSISDASGAMTDLKRIALEAGIQVNDNDFDSLFAAIERRLTQVTVFGVETGLRPVTVGWAISILVIALLLIIRNSLGRVIGDADLGLDAPLIILDGQKGLEKLLAGLLLTAILLAPWIANGCLIALIWGEVAVNGAISSGLYDFVVSALSLSLFAIGGWASLTTTSQLLRLRQLRMLKPAAA